MNPYASIGQPFQIGLEFRDSFGNGLLDGRTVWPIPQFSPSSISCDNQIMYSQLHGTALSQRYPIAESIHDRRSVPMRAPRRPAVLQGELDRATLHERRRALRALLMHPLLTAEGPQSDALALVRRHADWLREWLARNVGWTLQLDSELARLRKTPADLKDGSRPAREPKNKDPFNRRRYVLLCLALAALERSDRQITLNDLAQTIVHFVSGDEALQEADLRFDLKSRGQRRDLVQVVRFLLGLEVLKRVDGDEQHYLQGRGDALYNVRRPALAALLDVRHSPSMVEAKSFEGRLAALVEEPLPDSPEVQNRRLRIHLTRRLLDDPVLYFDELGEDEIAYLRSQRYSIMKQIEEATGLVPEVRLEGLAMVDEKGHFTDFGLPEEGTKGHLTLLLAQHLADHARSHPGQPLGLAALEQHTAHLVEQNRRRWARWATEPGAEGRILNETIERLAALRLVECREDGVLPRPAVGRFQLVEMKDEA